MRQYSVPNISATPTFRFLMDPRVQIAALANMEKLGLELVAIYHSHPDIGSIEPSQTDIRENGYPDVIMVIIAPTADNSWAARAFQIAGTQHEQVAIQVC